MWTVFAHVKGASPAVAVVSSIVSKWKPIGLFVLVLLLMGAAGWHRLRRPETTAAMHGRDIARRMGCFACHGEEGTGGVPTIGSTGKTMPGWDHATAVMYIQGDQEIREWILYGAPLAKSPTAALAGPDGLVPMPAYEGLLTDRELHDLVAYFRAVSWWTPDIPGAAYAGRKTASRLGCFGCHGPSGIGGVPNPGSLKGHIPPWDGEEFEELVRNEEELREWIMDGHIRRLQDNPFARHFLEGQKTQMPAYRGHISGEDLDAMVAFIQWLREQ